jgi:hypothetical protein
VVSRLLPLVLLAAALGASCAVSPQPSPPSLSGVDVEIEEGKIGITNELQVRGNAGSATPAEGVVQITNLDATGPVAVAPVAADGSFDAIVPGVRGDTLRLQHLIGRQRSEPLDVVLFVEGTGFAGNGLDCLVSDAPPAFELDLGATRAVTIDNRCTESVSLAAPRLRRGAAGFAVDVTTTIDLAPGESRVLRLSRPATAAENEDVLLLDVTAPAPLRRAFTLYDD